MLRLAICDDDAKVVEQIRNIADQYFKDTQMNSAVEIYQDGSQVLKKAGGSDIFFLDIEMPGMSGIQVAQELRANNKRAKIIFVTGYEEYQSAAFQLHAFSYLIKPFTAEDIKRQLEEAIDYLDDAQETSAIVFHTVDGDVHLSPEQISFIVVKTVLRQKASAFFFEIEKNKEFLWDVCKLKLKPIEKLHIFRGFIKIDIFIQTTFIKMENEDM